MFHQFSIYQLKDRVPDLECVIDFFAHASGEFVQQAAENHDFTTLDQPEAQKRTPSLLLSGWPS